MDLAASWKKPWPLGSLMFGLGMLLLAVIGTFTGKAYGKGGACAVRTEDPFDYWMMLAVQYLGGIYLVWQGASALPSHFRIP